MGDQCTSEIAPLLVLLDHRLARSVGILLQRNRLALFDEVKRVPHFALDNYVLPVLVHTAPKHIGDLAALLGTEAPQHGHTAQELLVHRAAGMCGLEDDRAERDAVEPPERRGLGRDNARRTGVAVHER